MTWQLLHAWQSNQFCQAINPYWTFELLLCYSIITIVTVISFSQWGEFSMSLFFHYVFGKQTKIQQKIWIVFSYKYYLFIPPKQRILFYHFHAVKEKCDLMAILSARFLILIINHLCLSSNHLMDGQSRWNDTKNIRCVGWFATWQQNRPL